MDRKKCKCAVCEGGMTIEQVQLEQQEHVKKYGFVIHYVGGYENEYVNAHTHGFQETWNHTDFQIVIPIPPETVNEILWVFANRVKGGESFKDGEAVFAIIEKWPVYLMETTEANEHKVLRIIFPDKNGNYPGNENCDANFNGQRTVQVI